MMTEVILLALAGSLLAWAMMLPARPRRAATRRSPRAGYRGLGCALRTGNASAGVVRMRHSQIETDPNLDG